MAGYTNPIFSGYGQAPIHQYVETDVLMSEDQATPKASAQSSTSQSESDRQAVQQMHGSQERRASSSFRQRFHAEYAKLDPATAKGGEFLQAQSLLLGHYRKFLAPQIVRQIAATKMGPLDYQVQVSHDGVLLMLANSRTGERSAIARHVNTLEWQVTPALDFSLPAFNQQEFEQFSAAEQECRQLAVQIGRLA